MSGKIKGYTDAYINFLGTPERITVNNMHGGCVAIMTEPEKEKTNAEEATTMILPNEKALNLAYWIIKNIPNKE